MAATATQHVFKIEYIQPFIDGTTELFKSRLDYKPTLGELTITKQLDVAPRDIVALIRFSGVDKDLGALKGNTIFALPEGTAAKLAGELLQEGQIPKELIPQKLEKAFRFIADFAKVELNKRNMNVSPPEVTHGDNCLQLIRPGTPHLCSVCTWKYGVMTFAINITHS